jgi:hypothetical protein
MTHARIYQQGVKAFFNAKPLGSNPFDSAVNSASHEAWKDGWLVANHSRWRWYSSLAAMRVYVSKDAMAAAAVPRMQMPTRVGERSCRAAQQRRTRLAAFTMARSHIRTRPRLWAREAACARVSTASFLALSQQTSAVTPCGDGFFRFAAIVVRIIAGPTSTAALSTASAKSSPAASVMRSLLRKWMVRQARRRPSRRRRWRIEPLPGRGQHSAGVGDGENARRCRRPPCRRSPRVTAPA